jgi:tetratricopeptide (TPR) repeat protein
MYSHVVVVKRPVFELAAKAPRLPPDLSDDYFSWFSECMVRAVELRLRKLSPSEKESILGTDDITGYVMVRPIFAALAGYEQSEPSMKNYFPDLIRGIDLKAEMARVADIVYAKALPPSAPGAMSQEEVSRRRAAAITTVPNDADAISQLSEGERQIAAKNPRAAEASFKAVLAKYPDQVRAWYGLGLVALVDHDSVRAKEVFGRLTTGEHAATNDPMVMSWSHVYLARVLEDGGEVDRAKSEYQAALLVAGAPTQAHVAAQKGLGDLETRKPAERP